MPLGYSDGISHGEVLSRITNDRDGDIVEQGTQGELLARNGFYAELYDSQFETAPVI